jgi:hypothetical protein
MTVMSRSARPVSLSILASIRTWPFLVSPGGMFAAFSVTVNSGDVSPLLMLLVKSQLP